jgi:sortase (surface protein transpeptidase)
MSSLKQLLNIQLVFMLSILFVGYHLLTTFTGMSSLVALFRDEASATEYKKDKEKPASSSVVTSEQMSAIDYGLNYDPDDWPLTITIPRLGLTLPVVGSLAASDRWDTSSTQANFAINTALPNGKVGNTVIFAENTPWLFGRLDTLVAGDEIAVDRYEARYTYLVVGLTIAQNQQQADISQILEPTLTLISAPSWQTPQKLIVTAKLKGSTPLHRE